MRSVGLLLIAFFAIWRVGGYVNWSAMDFVDEFSNEKDDYQQPAEDSCFIDSGGQDAKVRVGGPYCKFKEWSEVFKAAASDRIQQVLPSPHSELVMGMVLGENRFKLVPTYNDILKKVGLVHVVVVSGYNISLVFTLLMRILGSQYKIKNLFAGLFITLIYAGISGFGIPALRAWIMGSIAVIFKFYGRPMEGIKVLIFSAMVILSLAPSQLFSVSFLLSFLATLGVMTVPEALKGLLGLKARALTHFVEDFITSLSAQLMVNPVISYYFGTLSLASLLANPLVLWVVPICTILGGLLVFSSFVSPLLSHLLAMIIFPFLDYFVSFSEFFANFTSASVALRFSYWSVFGYYLTMFFALKHFNSGRKV